MPVRYDRPRVNHRQAIVLIVFAVIMVVLPLGCVAGLIWWITRCNHCGELLRQASTARLSGDIAAAQSLYNEAVISSHWTMQRALAYGGRAAVELEYHKDEDAIRDYTTALARDNNVPGLYGGRALALQRKGEFGRALDDYEAALRQDPNDAFVFLNRCSIFIVRSEWPKALADLTEAIRCQPENAEAFAARGSIYDQLRDYDRAFSDYDVALRLNPLISRAYRGRSFILRRRQQVKRANADEAAAAAAAAITLSTWPPSREWTISSRLASLCYNAADAAGKAKAYQQAIVFYTLALTSAELSPEARGIYQLNRGIAYMDLDDWQTAEVEMNASIALHSTFDGSYIDRANIALHFGRYDDAIADCNVAIKLNPLRAEGFVVRGDSYAKKAEKKAALDDFARAAELNPNSTDLYLHRASFFTAEHRPTEALMDVESCARINPDLPSAFFIKGAALRALGKFAEANQAYERGLVLEPEPGAGTLNNIAWFYATCPDSRFRRPFQAICLASRACDLTHWRAASQRDTLAAAYAAAGDFDAAVVNETSALVVAKPDAASRAEMEQRLTLFEHQQPFFVSSY